MFANPIALLAYSVVVFVAAVAVAYGLRGTKVFGTAGHTSSEFKLVMFLNVNAILTLWMLRAETGEATNAVASMVSGVVWSMAVVNAAYILGRSWIKAAKK